MVIDEFSDIKIERATCLSGTLEFTKYHFRKKTGKRFVVNSHHERICQALDDVIDGKIKRLIINIAPRYSKTELAVKNFIAYGLALNPASKFIHLSYSDDLAHDNSEEIRDEIVKSEAYQRLFPWVKIKQGSDAKKKWYTTEKGGVYATSAAGQVTGFGAGAVDDEDEELSNEVKDIVGGAEFAGAIIIDDPIKPEDAFSDTKREQVNRRFETTIRNRVNSRNTPIIIIMQRLHEHDLCGYLQELEPDEWTVLSLPCIETDEDGNEKALWEFKHTIEELHKIENADPIVYQTQYMQRPTPIEGLMYSTFKTYDIIPHTRMRRKKAYIDTADTGSDYLCAIFYDETEIGNFVTDILYTPKPMEYTEPKTAEMIGKNETEEAIIESNNGGRGFARNVEKQCRIMQNNKVFIRWFHQSENKQVRIYTKSAEVQNLTYYPSDWERRWPEYAKHIKSYRKEGKNSHDDAEDAITGTVEYRPSFFGNPVFDKDDLGLDIL
jgi:predicted phage terminase large subunit-like protein